jgi:Tol biopolymer transport system component
VRHLTKILAAVAMCACAAMTASVQAKVPGPNGRILFARFDPAGDETRLFTANPDGTDEHQLLPDPSCCAHWSPDGSKISAAASAPDGRITTALVNPDGSGFVAETIPDPTLNLGCPAWAPDASRLACEGWDEVQPDRPAGLFTIRASDWDDLVRVTTNPFGTSDIPGDYSPDGTRIVLLRENPRLHAAALFVVNVNGSGLRQITPWQPGELPTASWSPDGQWILTDNAQGGLYVVHPDGTGLHQIPVGTGSRARAFAFQPGWSPDGRKIVFSLFTGRGPGTGQEDIYTANADGTEVTHVTTTPDFEEGAEWGPYTG